MDWDYTPLSAACVRALTDKTYEKRRAAALEIEKMVKEFANVQNTGQIRKLLKVLGQDFALSKNQNYKKGGLIGLAAIAVALGKETGNYTEELISPIIINFSDSDLRVRYYACESLYNVIKVARNSVLPHFGSVFEALSNLAADPDQNIKNASELLDRLMKDIVTEDPSFDMVGFMPLLRERMHTNNQFACQFIISWISVLVDIPHIDLIVFLPDILDGLFKILAEPTPEIKKMLNIDPSFNTLILKKYLQTGFDHKIISMQKFLKKLKFLSFFRIFCIDNDLIIKTGLQKFFRIEILEEGLIFYNIAPIRCETVLNKFLRSIKQDPSRVNFCEMINIVTCHAQSNDKLMQFIALTWVKEFVQLSGINMLPYTSSILIPVFKCLSNGLDCQHIKETAKAINFVLLKLVGTEEDYITQTSRNGDSDKDANSQLDLPSVVEVLSKKLLEHSVESKVAVLNWISELNLKMPNRMLPHIEELFPLLLRTLSDISDQVVHYDLKVLSEIISSPSVAGIQRNLTNKSDAVANEQCIPDNHYFNKFVKNLLKEFSSDKKLLEKRGSFIIRRLCVLLNSEDVFRVLALILVQEEDNLKFASMMVEHLNTILLTSSELFELRVKLKDLKTKESYNLFHCLYNTWCHNPVATIALCLLTQNYQHACDIIRIFSDLEITVDMLVEVDKLIQLIESPIFTYLRLELLEVPNNQHLVYALYGLLMILPQSDAFHMLKHRLDCIPKLQLFPENRNNVKLKINEKPVQKDICFEKLLHHFVSVQEKHKEYKIINRLSIVNATSNREYDL